MLYKEKHRSQAEAGRNYRLCDDVMMSVNLPSTKGNCKSKKSSSRGSNSKLFGIRKKALSRSAERNDRSSHSKVLLSDSGSEEELSCGSKQSLSFTSSESSTCSLSGSSSTYPVFAVPKTYLRDCSPPNLQYSGKAKPQSVLCNMGKLESQHTMIRL